MQARRTLDPYAILGVDRSATPLQVARAHRTLAKRHHPDLHAGTESALEASERMRRINEAWQILSNPARRREFDRTYPLAGIAVGADAPPIGGHWASTRAPQTHRELNSQQPCSHS